MNTPIADFIAGYTALDPLRLHMPGHKGKKVIGPESMDISEITGADTLYEAGGIIRESEENAALLFGAKRTFYSAEGASLAVRAMLCLPCLKKGRKTVIAAARNSHISFYTGAMLLGIDVVDIDPSEDGYISAEAVGRTVETFSPDAVYLTSPDYEGRIADIKAISDIAHASGIPLLVDNAHGAYLKFLKPSLHPLDLGADISADSAHKTLPVLTGGAYLHIAKSAPEVFCERAQAALRLFSSTSPSYLILCSLDKANRLIAKGLDNDIRAAAGRAGALKEALLKRGFKLIGDEPLKLTIDAASYGWRGDEMAKVLEKKGVYAEAFNTRELILMFSAFNDEHDFETLGRALFDIEKKAAIHPPVISVVRGKRVMDMRQAWLGCSERAESELALGRVLAEPISHCPPGVPIALPGEQVGEELIEALRHLGIGSVAVIA